MQFLRRSLMVARVVGILALAAATLASPQSASAAVLCYVKWNAAGLNNGGSWTNAFTNLQSALGSLCSDVWVAAGVYKPDGASPGDQTLSFTVMAIGGGSACTADLPEQRRCSPSAIPLRT